MEIINLTALLAFLSFIFVLIKALKNSKLLQKYETLPPSPLKLPIIGHLHLIVGRPLHHALERLAHKYGPVFYLQFGELPIVVISSREATKAVLKDQDPACADRPVSIASKIICYDSDVIFSPYNDYWRQMRKIFILELLSAKNVKSFTSIRRDEVSCLVKSIQSASGESINLTEKLSLVSSSIVCRAAFGKVMRDRDTMISVVEQFLSMANGLELADIFRSSKLLNLLCWNKHKLLRLRRKLDSILEIIIEEHKVKHGGEFGGEDIVDVLLRIKRSGEISITNNNIKAMILDLFGAGTETVALVVDWAMAELMRNPRVMAKVQAEVRETCKGRKTVEESDMSGLKYMKLVIKETMRLHPPAFLLPRACRDECRVNGYSFPMNCNVLVNMWSLTRNPEYWHKPDTFCPERFENSSIDFLGNNFEFTPFGAGKRICPGMTFGLASVELMLAQLLYHFDWKVPEGSTLDDIDMSEANGLTAPRKNGLFVVPVVYKSLDY